jgi:hypothetical protein
MDPETSPMPPPVLLLWTDAESGEDLQILVHGPPEFLEELRAEGFKLGWMLDDLGGGRDAGRRGTHVSAPCVVVASH